MSTFPIYSAENEEERQKAVSVVMESILDHLTGFSFSRFRDENFGYNEEYGTEIGTEPMRHLSFEQGDDAKSSSPFQRFHLDECRAITQQVPEAFDLGTTPVHLNCLAVSSNYFALGSDCGALFLFNRKINKSVRPLRTSFDEVITCLQLYESLEKQRDYLAIGHKSGTLILLYLPTSEPGGNRKMKQSIQEDSHRGHAICAISWADGSKLFSADESGMITMTHVDFLNEEFINVFVCSTNSRIRSLQSFDNYLVWCVAESFKIVDVNHNCEPVFEISPEINGHISGVTFAEINEEEILIVLTNNGHLIGYGIDNESKGEILFHKNLESIMNSSNANDVQFHGSPTRQRHSQWSSKDCSASRLFIPQNVVYNVNPLIYYLPNKMLVCHLDSPSIEECSPEYPLLKIELFHFDDLLSDATSFKVLDIAYANENGDELFILTDAQKVLRLATSSVPNELVFAEEEKPSVSVLFNSLSLAAAKSSRHLFGKIEKLQSSQAATAGMQFMDNFLVGSAVGVNGKKESSLSSYPIINHMENVRENEKEENAWTSARLGFSIPKGFGLLSEERSTKIASNFQNIVDHLKVSNLMTDFNHSPLSAEQRQETLSFYKEDDQGEFASTSSTAGDSNFFSEHDVNSEEQTVERVKFPSTLSSNINVNVSRKSRAKRIRLPEIDEANLNSGDGLKHFSDKNEETFAQGQNDRLRIKLSSSPQCGKVQKNPEDDLPLSNINLDKILKVIGQTDDAENLSFGHDPTEMEDQHLDDSGSASEDEVTSRKSLVDTEYDNNLIKFNDDEEVTSLSVSILPMEPQDFIIESRMAEKHERKDVAEPFDEMIVTSERIDEASTSMQDKKFTISDHNEISSRSDTNSLADDTEIIMDSIDEAVIAQLNMYSVHKSGYQIHSATPSCSSSANESSLERNNVDYLIISGLVNHRTDIWTQLIAPYQICCMDICENYIAICPSAASGGLFSLQKRSRPLYRLLNTMDNGVMGGSWMPVKISGGQPTSSLAVNDSGNILWRIDSNGFAYSPVTTDPFSPVPSDNTWIGQTGEEGAITSVALTTKNAWYSTKKGVYVQLNLPEMGILFRTECPFELTKLAASDQAVWALRSDTGNLVVRIGLQHCPMGVDWVEDNLSGLPRKFVSIALYGQFGFGLDSAGNLFMINGVTESTPFGVGSWFQICSFQPHTMSMDVFSTNAKNGKRLAESAYLAPFAQWQLKVGKAGVFINAGHVILAARQPLTGHIITRVVPHRLSAMDNFTTISAGGFCGESNDAVYVSLQPTAEIFVYSVRKRNFTSLPAFSHDLSRTAKYMSSSRSYLFVLDDVGTIHYRHNLRDGHSFFTNGSQPRRTSSEWDTLSQIPTSIAIISLAISNTSLWVITSEHRLYWMDVSQIETADMNSWIEVDKPKGSESDKIDQVRSSSTGKYVWIFVGQTGLCWARIDVNESHRQGRAWAQASSDVQISELAVAENAVWCLSKNDNELHRLRGLCLNNPAGHYWKPMRHCLKAISVDAFENRLWALDEENRIVKHEMQIYPPTCLPQPNRLLSVSKASENYRTNDSMQEEKCSVDKLYKDEELDRISLDPLQSWCLLNNSNEDREEESDPGASTCEENSLQELRYTSSLKPNSSNSYLYGSYLYL